MSAKAKKSSTDRVVRLWNEMKEITQELDIYNYFDTLSPSCEIYQLIQCTPGMSKEYRISRFVELLREYIENQNEYKKLLFHFGLIDGFSEQAKGLSSGKERQRYYLGYKPSKHLIKKMEEKASRAQDLFRKFDDLIKRFCNYVIKKSGGYREEDLAPILDRAPKSPNLPKFYRLPAQVKTHMSFLREVCLTALKNKKVKVASIIAVPVAVLIVVGIVIGAFMNVGDEGVNVITIGPSDVRITHFGQDDMEDMGGLEASLVGVWVSEDSTVIVWAGEDGGMPLHGAEIENVIYIFNRDGTGYFHATSDYLNIVQILEDEGYLDVAPPQLQRVIAGPIHWSIDSNQRLLIEHITNLPGGSLASLFEFDFLDGGTFIRRCSPTTCWDPHETVLRRVGSHQQLRTLTDLEGLRSLTILEWDTFN